MAEYPLGQNSWSRARANTISTFHTIRFWLFELCTFAGLTIWVLLWTPPWVKDWGKVVYQILVPLAGVFMGLAIVFLLSLFVAPYRQRNEARKLVEQQRIPSESEVNDVIRRLEEETLVLKREEEEQQIPFSQVFLAIADDLSVGVESYKGLIRKGLDLGDSGRWYLQDEEEGISHLIGRLDQYDLVDRHNEEYQHTVRDNIWNEFYGINELQPPHLERGTRTEYYLSSLGATVVRQLRQRSTLDREGSETE